MAPGGALMAETEFAVGAPPFPDETIDGWAVRWARSDVRSPWSHQNRTALAIFAGKDGKRLVHAAWLAESPPTAAALARTRDLLLLWLRGAIPAASSCG